MSEVVDEEVHLSSLRIHAFINEGDKEASRFLVSAPQGKGVAKVIDIFVTFQFRNACG